MKLEEKLLTGAVSDGRAVGSALLLSGAPLEKHTSGSIWSHPKTQLTQQLWDLLFPCRPLTYASAHH